MFKKMSNKKAAAPLPAIPIKNVKDINYLNVEFLLRTTNFDVDKISSYQNGKKEEKFTLLYFAIHNRDEKLVDYLLEKRANVNLKLHPCSQSFAYFAVDIDDDVLLRKLIAHGIDIDDESVPGKQTVLFKAAYNGRYKMAKILVENGANVNHRDFHNTTPLMISSTFEVTKLLLDHGADVNAMSEFCGSALMWAIQTSDISRIKLLLERGAEINCVKINRSGTEPLVHFMTHWIQTESLKFLLYFSDELDVNVLNDRKQTALHLLVTRPISACDNEKWLPLIHEFLNAGIDINQEDLDQKLVVECRTDRNFGCISVVKKHVVKLISLGCFQVSERNRAAVEDRRYDKLRIACEEESKIISGKKINDSAVTFYDVLSKSVNELVDKLEKVHLSSILDSSLQLDFPNYGGMIYYKLLKVNHKMKL